MSLNLHGTGTLNFEVTNISHLGFWVLIEEFEYFVPFGEYPVFKNATIQEIFNMIPLSPTQLHWPDLDADIEIEALENAEKYPLVWKNG